MHASICSNLNSHTLIFSVAISGNLLDALLLYSLFYLLHYLRSLWIQLGCPPPPQIRGEWLSSCWRCQDTEYVSELRTSINNSSQ